MPRGCTHTCHPWPGEESMDRDIEMGPGACCSESLTVWPTVHSLSFNPSSGDLLLPFHTHT